MNFYSYSRRTLTITLIVLMSHVLTPIALAQEDALQACAAIVDIQARLLCYDELATESRINAESPRSETATDSPSVTSTPTQASDRESEIPGQAAATSNLVVENFGVEQERAISTAPESIVATVTAARHSDFTGWTIEFDNGQIWKQIGTDPFRIQTGERYVITRAFLNSFLMNREGYNQRIRVSRQQ